MASRRADGFTLMEMMIVIVVMGLLLGLVLTNRPDRSPTLDLRAATSRVAQALRLARARSIATDRPVAFIIDPHTRSFGTLVQRYLLPRGVVMRQTGQPILFEPDGSATSGAIMLGVGRMRREIRVHWLTGQVSVGRITG